MINTNRFRKFALSTDGTFYTTDTKGITRSTDHGCTWTAVTGDLATLHTTDLDVDPVDGATAWVSTGDGGTIAPDGFVTAAVNGVFVTHDHGATWAPAAGLTAQSARIFDSVRVAPSSAQVVYASSNNQSSPFAVAVHRSPDGGANFTTTALTYQLDGVDPHALEVLAVDPRDSNVVWARALAQVPEGATTVDRHGLLRSSDGGATWAEIYKADSVTEASGQTRGIDDVAFDLANNRVYVATRTGVLAGSDDGSATRADDCRRPARSTSRSASTCTTAASTSAPRSSSPTTPPSPSRPTTAPATTRCSTTSTRSAPSTAPPARRSAISARRTGTCTARSSASPSTAASTTATWAR